MLQVSWLRRRPAARQGDPVLLTFGQSVYVSDVRFSIRRSNEDWILNILHAKSDDEAIYECQVSTEPPQIHKIFLAVEGLSKKEIPIKKESLSIYKCSHLKKVQN